MSSVNQKESQTAAVPSRLETSSIGSRGLVRTGTKPMMQLPGYEMLEFLREDPHTVLYRCLRQQDHEMVMVRLLKETYPSTAVIARLERDYRVSKELDLPCVIAPRALLKSGMVHALVQEDFGAVPLAGLIANVECDLAWFFKVAQGIAEVLGQVHRHDIVHQHLSAGRILINQKTGQIKLDDFGGSLQLTRSVPAVPPSEPSRGLLTYLAPEQSGRTNQDLDHRVDFYALGVIFYEMLVGKPPFESADGAELIFHHMAKRPKDPHQLRPEIPAALSAIVLKLLAKNPVDRYMSAHGLKEDLIECQTQWAAGIVPIQLRPGANDVPDRFEVSNRFYGRVEELKQLFEIFERVSAGAKATLLMEGYSGIGKSRLVEELTGPVARRRAFMVSGKCAPLRGEGPYGPFIAAMTRLIHQVLADSNRRLERLEQRLLARLGGLAPVLREMLPALALIMRDLPERPPSQSTESRDRFSLAFRTLIECFCDAEHPLVLMIDDLQWADYATLGLIDLLTCDGEISHLMLLGAYRSGELPEQHPLSQLQQKFRKNQVPVLHLEISPLHVEEIGEMLTDTLYAGLAEVAPLARLVHEKTGGNPFYVTQFLQRLYDEELLTFDPQAFPSSQSGRRRGGWCWNMAAIKKASITANMVEILLSKIRAPRPRTRLLLKLGSCMGARFSAELMALVLNQSVTTINKGLWEATRLGFVRPVMTLDDSSEFTPGYEFVHDKVRETIYSLVPEHRRKQIHLSLGRHMLQHHARDEGNEYLFEMANHLNLAQTMVLEAHERLLLARVDLEAGQRARQANAYQEALVYLKVGMSCLPEDGWISNYELTYSLHLEHLRCAYLANPTAAVEDQFKRALENARSKIDKVALYTTKASQLIHLGRHGEAISTGIEGLRLLQIQLSENPGILSLVQALAQVRWMQGRRDARSLEDLPEALGERERAAMDLLMVLWGPTFLQRRVLLHGMVVLKMVKLTLKYGNNPVSAVAFATYGGLLSSLLRRPQTGYPYGDLALGLAERYHDPYLKSIVLFTHAVFLAHHRQHPRECVGLLREAFSEGLISGNLLYAGYSADGIGATMPMADFSLEEIWNETDRHLAFAHRIENRKGVLNALIVRHWVNILRHKEGPAPQLAPSLIGEIEKEGTKAGLFYLLRLQAYYMLCRHQDAQNMSRKLEGSIMLNAGGVFLSFFAFWDALNRLALCREGYVGERKRHLKVIVKHLSLLRSKARIAPKLFAHQVRLVEAEWYRVKGRRDEASTAYDDAARLATEVRFPHHETLARDLAARFYLETDRPNIARVYLTEARNGYAHWGATAVVAQMDEQFPRWFSTNQGAQTQNKPYTGWLDLNAVMKASLAISGEIVLADLLKKLVHIVMENAGANRVVLLLEQDEQWYVEASGNLEQPPVVLQSMPLETNTELPHAVIQYVIRTREAVVLHDAAREGDFTRDEYLARSRTKSVLCTPVMHQRMLSGILYAENKLSEDAFTRERLEVLQLLSAQMAISIENARLYAGLSDVNRNLEEKVMDRTRQLRAKNEAILHTQRQLLASIQVAEQIQDAVYPPEEKLRRLLPPHFVLFRGREVVSGDFYWCEHSGESTYLVVADCTGHGVPGAFLAMAGYSMLNKIILEQGLQDPAEILGQMHRDFREMFRRVRAPEGIDLILCRFDESGRISFAGARRPLLHVKEGQLHYYKGISMSIGDNREKEIITQHIQAGRGDTLYLTTDGFADQNNPIGHKFGTPAFHQLLTEIAGEPPEQQKQRLERELFEYMGGVHQRDDITIIGLNL